MKNRTPFAQFLEPDPIEASPPARPNEGAPRGAEVIEVTLFASSNASPQYGGWPWQTPRRGCLPPESRVNAPGSLRQGVYGSNTAPSQHHPRQGRWRPAVRFRPRAALSLWPGLNRPTRCGGVPETTQKKTDPPVRIRVGRPRTTCPC